jgi:hypothetical protein
MSDNTSLPLYVSKTYLIMSVNNSLPLNVSTAQLPVMHQQNLTTVSFYNTITANVCQLNLNTACFYSVITANLNKSLPSYISTSQLQVQYYVSLCNVHTVTVSTQFSQSALCCPTLPQFFISC